MNIYFSLMLILISGMMNGSFVMPAKYVNADKQNIIWLAHSIISLMLLPWLLVAFKLIPSGIYHQASINVLLAISISGLIFGLGQISFITAIETLGLALSFAVNLGLSVAIGSLFTVVLHHALFQNVGLLVLFCVLIITLGLVLNYYSTKSLKQKVARTMAMLFVIFAGVSSGLQNITFIYITFNHNVPTSNPYWIWPLFLTFASLPMIVYYSGKSVINWQQRSPEVNSKLVAVLTLSLLMGILFTGSIVLYSAAVAAGGILAQLLGWPIFMITIVLTTEFWQWFSQDKDDINYRFKMAGIACLCLAIILLTVLHR